MSIAETATDADAMMVEVAARMLRAYQQYGEAMREFGRGFRPSEPFDNTDRCAGPGKHAACKGHEARGTGPVQGSTATARQRTNTNNGDETMTPTMQARLKRTTRAAILRRFGGDAIRYVPVRWDGHTTVRDTDHPDRIDVEVRVGPPAGRAGVPARAWQHVGDVDECERWFGSR